MNLFEKEDNPEDLKNMPLAVRMCPRSLEEFVGQRHILGKGKLLRRAIEADRISSLILYGPPGSGKTALAYCISKVTNAYFVTINATTSNVEELRNKISEAKQRYLLHQQKTILFIDEIHRFNKAQQDVLMPDLEKGNPVLIGATTHNPFFSLVSPLLSRSLVFQLNPLSEKEILEILRRAIRDKERGLGNLSLKIEEEALLHLAKVCEGDARRALNALEIGSLTTPPDKQGKINFTLQVAEESIQKKAVIYDKDEDGHYDTISAFIKAIRGSDPDAALYWLAKMLYAGEDPRFIARRILISAAEDVGNADPLALVVATSCFQAVEFLGLPECRIPLAQATTYIASCPKSNAAYMAIEKAMEDVKKERTQEVPRHLRDTHYRGAEKLGYGKGYKYPHQFKDHFVKQDYLPQQKQYYFPTDLGYEKIIKERRKEQK
ncbi:MAG: replication-associated recombination protein A [Candidatus Omnitrophica bacterium]|nr:replication-associated recombination protein A [Candidatus Omnitrophota bacterium]MCM8793858.1 replication-associated recombination protein A [Candidatus Omnitrophota bacterium]